MDDEVVVLTVDSRQCCAAGCIEAAKLLAWPATTLVKAASAVHYEQRTTAAFQLLAAAYSLNVKELPKPQTYWRLPVACRTLVLFLLWPGSQHVLKALHNNCGSIEGEDLQQLHRSLRAGAVASHVAQESLRVE